MQVPIIDDSVFELSEAFTATISLPEDSDNIDIVELMPNSIIYYLSQLSMMMV